VTVNVSPATVNVPDLVPPVVAAALNCTVPFPLPLAPDVIVSQFTLLAAVHAQPAAAVTATLPVPPAAGTLALVGAMLKEQPVPWLTVNVWPAIATVPERAVALLAATVSFTVPFPLPLAPDAMVIQLTLLVAVQPQPPPAVTATLTSPPDAGTDWLDGAIANEQPAPWVTVIVCPPALIVPVRAAPALAATAKPMVPLPIPEVGPVSVIQGTSLLAVHAHPAPAVTDDVPVPPCESKVYASGATSTLQPDDWLTVTVWPATSTVPLLLWLVVG
jgi:hypothetical protein